MDKKPDNNNFRNTNRFQLDKVAFYGRTLLEYLKMFRIDDIDHLKRYNRILDCPSGASSFVAEANSRYGINAVGCDPLFDKDLRILQQQGEEDIEYVVNRVSIAPERYNWDFYSSTKRERMEVGHFRWLWNLMDETTRFWISTMVSQRWEVGDMRAIFQDSKNKTKTPKAIIHDGVRTYDEAFLATKFSLRHAL